MTEDEVQEIIDGLVEKGYIKMFIGANFEPHYTLTEMGEIYLKDNPVLPDEFDSDLDLLCSDGETLN